MWVPERYSHSWREGNEEKRKKTGREGGREKWDTGEGKIVPTLSYFSCCIQVISSFESRHQVHLMLIKGCSAEGNLAAFL